jgi:imidazolonepropionase-like amidohydrolase
MRRAEISAGFMAQAHLLHCRDEPNCRQTEKIMPNRASPARHSTPRLTRALCARLAIVLAGWVMLQAPLHAQPGAETLVLRGDKVYLSPDQPPLTNALVMIRGGRIVSVTPAADLPKGSPVPHATCSGPVVAAGFYNSHVHLLGPQWDKAAGIPRAQLEERLTALLARHGFTTAVDLGSDRDNTLVIQRRIASGEVTGPRVLTLGLPIFPPKGLPGYLLDMPPDFLSRMPQPESADAARKVVQDNLAAGAVGTKLFIITPQRGRLTTMPPDIARAAADATHEGGRMVVAHPTDIAGVKAAIAAGVDLLAHTTHGNTTPWPDDLLQQVGKTRIAMTPTLKLMGYELAKERAEGPIVNQLIDASVDQVRAFVKAGGEVLFGTDAGYMSDLDPMMEYVLLARAGLSPMDILASLTTRPAAKWKDAQRGKIAAGFVADVVVLDDDPAKDVKNFAKVRCTVAGGKVIFGGR